MKKIEREREMNKKKNRYHVRQQDPERDEQHADVGRGVPVVALGLVAEGEVRAEDAEFFPVCYLKC